MLRACLAIAILLSTSSASAVATIARNTTPTNPPWTADLAHEISSFVHVEYKYEGAIVAQVDCEFSCAPTPPAQWDEVGYVLNYDVARESIVSESCTGTTLGVGRCANGDYTVTLQLLHGWLNVVDVGADGLDVNVIDGSTRYHFGDGKYWDGGMSAGNDAFPAGTYMAEFRGVAPGYCKPVPRDARTPVTVVAGAGPSPQTEIVFEGTLCQYVWRNDGAQSSVVTASTGGSCALDGDNDTCTLEVPFGEDVVFSVAAEDGWYGYFSTSSGLCSQLNGSSSSCADARAEQDYTTEIRYLEVATAPALVVSAGSAPPADRELAKGSANNPVAHFSVAPRNGSPVVDRIFITATGTGKPNPDLTSVRVYIDADNDGMYDAGETQVGSGIFGATTGVATLNVNPSIAATTNFVVTVNVSNQLAASVDVPGAPWSLLLVVVVPVLVLYRRRRALAALTVVLLVVGAFYACGSGGGDDSQDGDDGQQSDSDTTVDDDTTDDGASDSDTTDNGPTDGDAGDNDPGDSDQGDGDDPNPDAVTFSFTVSISGDSGVIVEGGSVDGATVTVRR